MNHNKTVLCLKLGVLWSSLIIFMFFFLAFLNYVGSKPIDISLKTWTLFSIILTTAFVIIVYNQQKNRIHAIEYNIKGISKKFLFFDYYSRWLPAFLITSGISVFIIFIVYQIKLLAILGFLIFQIGFLSFYIIYSIGRYDIGLSLSLDLSYMIFMRYIYKKEIIDPLFIKKFTYFFEKCLKNIDGKLYKGTKISNLTLEDDNLSIRTIIMYLSPYVEYGSQYEIEILKNSLVNMRGFITKDNKLNSLKITNCVLEIYKNEKKFVLTYNYQIEPLSPLIKLYEDIKNPLIVSFGFLFLIILITVRSSFVKNSMFDFLQTDGMDILIQSMATLLASLLGVIVTFFGVIIPIYTRK